MPLIRNNRARNAYVKKKVISRELARKIVDLDEICEKHKVCDLQFKNCNLVDDNGNINYIMHSKIKSNMKISATLVVATSVVVSETRYDLVQLIMDKKERDEKKREEELSKTKAEIEKMGTATTAPPELPNTAHETLLSDLINNIQNSDPESLDTESLDTEILDTELIPESIEQVVQAVEPEVEPEVDKAVEPEVEPEAEVEQETMQNKKKKIAQYKREKALKQMKQQIAQKEEKNGNRYYKKFIRDVNAKYTLTERPEFKYFETQTGSTYMVMDSVKVYEINMPVSIKDKYLLIIGDLQLKSALCRQIDPTYNISNVTQNHNDFLSRIQEKENQKKSAANNTNTNIDNNTVPVVADINTVPVVADINTVPVVADIIPDLVDIETI